MKQKLFLWGGAGMLLLLFSVVISLSMGAADLPLSQVWKILFHQVPGIANMVKVNWPDSSEEIILQIRLPRIVLGVLIGAALSVAGAGFQGVLRNPLADPFTLGVASGSAVGAALLILTGLQFALLGIVTIPLIAFVTGIITLLGVLKLSNVRGKFDVETLILSGVIMQAFLGSIVSFLIIISSQTMNDIIHWLMGSLAIKGWGYSFVLFPYLFVGSLILIGYGRSLNLFSLGERQAAYLGIHVERTKLIVLVVSTLITAAAVSMVGVVGFVGLIIPHLIRLLVGPDYRLIIPLSLVYGGIFVLWSDTLARILLMPKEIPLGVITAFLGAPFFAYLLYKHKKTLRG